MYQIIQGESFKLPIKIKHGDTVLSPEDVEDVRIQLGDRLLTYSKSEITYDSSYWLYPITEAQTFAFKGSMVKLQVGVKVNADTAYSVTKNIPIDLNIIKETW